MNYAVACGWLQNKKSLHRRQKKIIMSNASEVEDVDLRKNTMS